MKAFAPFFILVMLAGCASQKVFLNDHMLNEASVKQVQELLESEGFEVQVISLQPPASIDSSTLLSGSRATFGPSVDRLVKALDELGYQNINTVIVQKGNHWYRGNNIGLYLFDAELTGKPGRNVQGEYRAEDCESMETLTLTRDQEFIITFSDSELLEGNWAVESMPYIHLFSSTPRLNFYYQVEFDRKKDFSWEVDIVRLHPLGNNVYIQDCVFVKGVRVN
ncbi:hypothetical protein CWE09_07700 [Aliidiomarina minuta]|uniref:Uncharacterized protein n=1 Tax=Aliidiomarina minuta TaxID=880057 RepID=A0A432WAF1_9GAMM|nr:hypothetical protein [Aliidiomarina minuta]RUO26578.1 hypothetical protein CWE09_07700 [Aliidiomarina minuta]